MSLRIRRGSDAERLGVRFDQGEIVWVNSTTTSRPAYKLYVGDGVTYGGRDIVETSAGHKLTYNTNTGRLDVAGLTTDDIAPGTNNKFFTNELAQDAVGAMFAAGTMSGIQFVYDDVANKMNVTVTATGGGGAGSGIAALVNDPSPHLGGSLVLNNQNINGIGNIDITGNLIASGTLTATTGLGSDLVLNGYNITGNGNINTGGDIHATGVISVSGLGADLALNTHNITGDGSIIINGSITSVTGLGADLPLNSYNITGNGNIILDSGSLTLSSGNATLTDGNLIISSGNITANGVNSTSATIATVTVGNNIITTDTPGSLTIDVGENPIIITGLQNSGNTQGAVIKTKQSRGTVLSPTAIHPSDFIGGMTTTAHNGNDYIYSGNFGFIQDSGIAFTSSSTFVPSFFAMTVPSATDTVNFIFNSAGVGIIPIVKTDAYSATGTPLPPAGDVGIGARAFVLDAVSNTFATAYSAGGTFKVPVYSDGTSWRIG
jgi:hypothetical protein